MQMALPCQLATLTLPIWGAVNNFYDNAAQANLGDIPLNDLAKIGQRFLKQPSGSLSHGGGGIIGGMVGTGLEGGLEHVFSGGVFNHPEYAALAALAGGSSRLAASGLRSKALANYLVNGPG